MRFLLVSTHIDQITGYSKVSYNLVNQLATLSPKVKTFHFGFQRHATRANVRKYPTGITSYDAAANEDPKEEGFGFNKIAEYIETVQPDVVMIYNDPYTISRFIDSMKHERGKSSYKLWLYVDQVYTGIAGPLIEILQKHADRIYCFTDIWKTKFLEYGPFPDIRILEHAVDPTVYTSMSEDARKPIRQTNLSLPADAVVILNANRNSQRKRIDLTVSGFAGLLKKNPEAPYYLAIASNLQPQTGAYYDIQRIYLEELKDNGLDFQQFGRRLLLIDTSPPNVLTDEAINQLYNAADIGINTSDGEGFGLCQLEHMYVGAPQIVTDIGSYRTFMDESTSEFIRPNGKFYFTGSMPHGFSAPTFASADVTTAMESMITSLPEKRAKVRAYQFKSWATICDGFLEDVLTQVEGPAASVSVPVISAVPI
jgi:glycosyltransferase involved in cell wall biosynthesis